jgi:hypothetical protein
MNTDEEKAKQFEIPWQRPSTISFHIPNCSQAIVIFINRFSLSLSVFIRVHLWIQRIYPTNASW